MSDGQEINAITDAIIGAAIRVHRQFGPGLLHSVYLACLAQELVKAEHLVEVEKPVPLRYGDLQTECAFRLDLLVDETVIVDVKCVDRVIPIHRAQMLTYLRLTGCSVGLILNFNVTVLRDGIVRVVNNLRNADGRLA